MFDIDHLTKRAMFPRFLQAVGGFVGSVLVFPVSRATPGAQGL
jgi:hypothetical protein